ncbi:unnamed protein product [Nezara viridula]|uniref:Carbonic anhydrase n=1 Tax=Nezara viridula TaxID=85310 RepID=A0A9P0E6A7_NEZVI|nr:unnamed protein product [Nezara viridula]
MRSLSVVLSLLLVAAVKSQENWNYTRKGDDWEGVCQTGIRQSPINILSRWTIPRFAGLPLRLSNYDQEVPVTVTVDQHHFTIRIDPDPSVRIAISGGGLRGNYVLQSAHFHYGSEHLIDTKRYALEAHLVHYREIYGNRTDAATNDPEGIAVLGTLYCEATANSNLEQVLQGANGEQVKLRFRDFLPRNLDFYRYQGSLTTPPCSEAVVWTVFKNSLPISQQQVDAIKGNFPDDVTSTYRNVQRLNTRRVERWGFRSGFQSKVDFLKSSLNILG